MIRRYRFINKQTQGTINKLIDVEYEDALASLGEDYQHATGHG